MKKNKIGFTLIELLVTIAIVMIIGIGVTRINFNSLNNKQKIEIYGNKIITNYEKIRNDSLLGKGIGINLNVPDKWKIEFSNTGSGKIISSYYLGDWIENDKLIFNDSYEIKEIKCLSLDDTLSKTLNNTEIGIIEIMGNNLSLTGSCNNGSYKKLETTIKYKNDFEEKIEINIINGLIQKK